MPVTTSQERVPQRIAVVLILLALLPAVFYSAYEFSNRSDAEEVMRDVYARQLDAVLYSLNQFSLDVAGSWATTLSGILIQGETEDVHLRDERLSAFVARTGGVQAVFLADSNGRVETVVTSSPDQDRLNITGAVQEAIRTDSTLTGRLLRYSRLEYRKLEPLRLDDGRQADRRVAVVYAHRGSGGDTSFAGIVFREETFLRDILLPRMRGAAGGEFQVVVLSAVDGNIVAGSDSSGMAAGYQRKALWMLPRYELGIRPLGTSIEDLVGRRFRRNLALIGVLDLVLLAAAWFVYRTVRAEVRLARAKSTFVSNVSHELRTPLALIRMYAETLDMGRLKDEQKKREYVATILRESERLTRLINNILNFSRMESGRKQYSLVPASLNDTVRGVMTTYGPHLEEERCLPVVEYGEPMPDVPLDREAVTEALINVIDNALKYSPGEKYLRVSTRQEAGGIVLEVEDHGCGIAPEHQKKVFDTFYRVPTGLVHGIRGSGLGLALVKQIMDAHGGTVSVRSSPGKGSTFRLWFPRDQSEKARR